MHVLFIHIEQDMDARGLDIGINHTHPVSLSCQQGCDICGCVGFSSAAAE